jgi:short-subunit dehydrogenase
LDIRSGKSIKGDCLTASTVKTAFITGASSGLGAEFALQLSRLGYDLLLTARRTDRLQQLADSIASASGVQVRILPADLSKMQDIDQLVSVLTSLSTLDLLVNSAGFGTVGRFHRVEPVKELAMMHVHMIAPVMFCRAVLPGMLSHNRGAIINVSSLAGLIPIRNVVYQSTKSFLVNFSLALHAELLGSQVHVQVLCPGFVFTQFHDTPEYTHFSRSGVPHFLWMTPNQVVSESLNALKHHRVICIPGHIYKLAGALGRNSISAGLIRFAAMFILRRRRTFINT